MSGVRLGGIDPSILRELSGVYKPFTKAFKELVSNAFDADAERVRVDLADDFSEVTISDDGTGMTPFEFRNDFTRIGGGSRRWLGERTRKGRLRIGSKGIGFLALARYCSTLEVWSSADRPFEAKITIPGAESSVSIDELIGFAIDETHFRRLKCKLRQQSGRIGKLVKGKHYAIDAANRELRFLRPIAGPIELSLRFDCKGIGFRAGLNFDRLLELADKADLDKLSEFATIELFDLLKVRELATTRITAQNLKAFVRKELQAGRRKGNVRNIASRSGLERFKWQLARCTPIEYEQVANGGTSPVSGLLKVPEKSTLSELRVIHAKDNDVLRRPVYPFEPHSLPLHKDMLVPVHIDEGGLKAVGFIAGFESIVFPAEYRGITIRVRGVAIGEPGFLGAEHLLTGANKAALSQITGEINILEGLDAVDALNPGRESFYEECDQYKILRHHIVGDGEGVAGCLGRTISAVLRRSQVRASLKDVLGRAATRRRALDDVSAAVSELIASGEKTGRAVLALLKQKTSHTNGLAGARDYPLDTPPRIGEMKVVKVQHLSEPAEIDYIEGEIRLDTARPEWDLTLMLFNRRLQVQSKRGGVSQPLGELDLCNEQLLLNWEHPIKSQMDERGFLRTAVSWILAKEASAGNAEQMMELALHLLSFRSAVLDG